MYITTFVTFRFAENHWLDPVCDRGHTIMPSMIYLIIEFIDELVFGVSEAAWPLIRNDLHLNYAQIGLALSLPGIIGNIIEPFLFVLGDVWKRRAIILLGGILF